jgi:hypothetical protein
MIKDQMDKKFGSPWHVIVGKAFAYEITYEVSMLDPSKMCLDTWVVVPNSAACNSAPTAAACAQAASAPSLSTAVAATQEDRQDSPTCSTH